MSETKKCPMCAELIPLEASICPYCEAKFMIVSEGYCPTCHDKRRTTALSENCSICGSILIDRYLQSIFLEEPSPSPSNLLDSSESIPVPPPPLASHRPHRQSAWALNVLFIILLAIAAIILFEKRSQIPFINELFPSPTPIPTLTSTLAPPYAVVEQGLTIGGLPGDVNSVVFSPDGRLFALAAGSAIVVYDLNSFHLVFTLNNSTSSTAALVNELAWSPDGTMLAAASNYGIISFWDMQTGDLIRMISENLGYVLSADFSPDGSILATGSGDNNVHLWNSQTGELLATLSGHNDNVTSVAWSPDGSMLASASEDGYVIIWRAQFGERLATLADLSPGPYNLAWSPDGAMLAVALGNKIVILDSADWREIRELEPERSVIGIDDVAWSPDGSMIAASDWDNAVLLWGPLGVPIRTPAGHSEWINCVAWSNNGEYVLSGARDSSIIFWHVIR